MLASGSMPCRSEPGPSGLSISIPITAVISSGFQAITFNVAGTGRTRRRFSYQGANRKWHGILNKRRVASGHQLNSNVDTNSCLRGVLGQIAAKRVMIIESRNEFLTECS